MASIVITKVGRGIQMFTNDQSAKFRDANRLCFDKHFGIEDCATTCVKIYTNIGGRNKMILLHHDNSNPNWGSVDTIAGVPITTHVILVNELYKLIQ